MLYLTSELLKEPQKFRFFHPVSRSSGRTYKRKGESEEDFEARKSLYTQFPGLIVDGEITKMAVCVSCGFVGKNRLNMLVGHLTLCPNDVEHLKYKEVEIVKNFKDSHHKEYNYINQHFQQVQVDKIECNICKELFSEMSVFKVHLREIHLIETNARKLKNTFGNFQCTECGKKFMKLSILQQHEISAHAKMELVHQKCEKCEKGFRTKSNYNVHMRTKHTDVRPYTCDTCAKSFKQKKHLDSHTTIHTQEKSWQCRHCEKSFSKEWTRTQHERLHLGIKPYKCDKCAVAFSQKNSLDVHEKVHHKNC